ncbi:4045_t:CDS:2 [Rhizophagus irregularis]|nr:4045_t:CDS:2 [Rhizophagus irregularis]
MVFAFHHHVHLDGVQDLIRLHPIHKERENVQTNGRLISFVLDDGLKPNFGLCNRHKTIPLNILECVPAPLVQDETVDESILVSNPGFSDFGCVNFVLGVFGREKFDINYTLKQKQVIEMLKLNHISILGLSKTKINKSQSKVVYNYLPNYTTYFDNDSAFPIGLGVEC